MPIYMTKFHLLKPVLEDKYHLANEYLNEPMEQYLHGELKEVISKIRWRLTDLDMGQITAFTEVPLTEKQLASLSDWVRGQCSDGLGEGFEQQDFANYDVGLIDEWTGRYDPERVWEDDYEEYWVMASFDWETNRYEFVEIT